MTAAFRSRFNLSAHLRPTVGDQKMTFADVDHMGWMKCDGRSLSRTTYALLFNVIGSTFGADDSSSFRLPDFRGTVPGIAGQPTFSNAANPTSYALGDKTGEQLHVLTIGEMPAHTHGSSNVTGDSNGNGLTGISGEHTHTINDPGHTHTYFNQPNVQGCDNAFNTESAADNVNVNQTSGSNVTGISINSAGNHQHTIGSTGGGAAHNNMQPTLFGGNMFIYSGRNIDDYFPYTWVDDVKGAVGIY
jgi:microcystin-dependent protein